MFYNVQSEERIRAFFLSRGISLSDCSLLAEDSLKILVRSNKSVFRFSQNLHYLHFYREILQLGASCTPKLVGEGSFFLEEEFIVGELLSEVEDKLHYFPLIAEGFTELSSQELSPEMQGYLPSFQWMYKKILCHLNPEGKEGELRVYLEQHSLEEKYSLAHGDASSANVLFPSNRAIFCDFDGALLAPPEYDYGVLLFNYWSKKENRDQILQLSGNPSATIVCALCYGVKKTFLATSKKEKYRRKVYELLLFASSA